MSKLRDYAEYGCPTMCEDDGLFRSRLAKRCGDDVDLAETQAEAIVLLPFRLRRQLWHESRSKPSTPGGKGKYPRVVETHGDSRRSIRYDEEDEDDD